MSSPITSNAIYEGAQRLVKLTEGIEALELSNGPIVLIHLEHKTECAEIPVSRQKLLELLHAEEEMVGATLARLLRSAFE